VHGVVQKGDKKGRKNGIRDRLAFTPRFLGYQGAEEHGPLKNPHLAGGGCGIISARFRLPS